MSRFHFPSIIFLVCVAPGLANQGSEWISKIKTSGIIDTNDVSEKNINTNLSHLWQSRKSQLVLGYIGPDFQRLRISFDSVQKAGPRQYKVVGKSRVFEEVCGFAGTLEMESVYKFRSIKDDCENTIRPSDYGVIIGKYSLQENKTCRTAGEFRGIFSTYFYVNNGVVKYDTLDADCSDDFHNHSFVGEWESLKTKKKKICNWGDHRIPFSMELDNGAGEFNPVEKYRKNGWMHFYDLQKGTYMDSLDTFEKDNKP